MSIIDIFKSRNKSGKKTEVEIMDSLPPEVIDAGERPGEVNFPRQLAAEVFRRIMEETEVPYVSIELTDVKPNICESMIGGLGYIPHGEEFPTDSEGNQFRLLAQIDCSEVALEEFPEKGLLQFWIMNNECFGADFNDIGNREGFRVIYRESIDTSVTEEEVRAKMVPNRCEKKGADYMPCDKEYGLDFSVGRDFMTEHDFRYDREFCRRYNESAPLKPLDSINSLGFDVEELEGFEDRPDLAQAFGHKIGGYPAFTQYDPRCGDEYDFLLLQLDSDFGNGRDKIMWGDAGLCSFFINREKLMNLDFSDVLYSWDCY